MAEIGTQFIVERSRLVAPIPNVGQTRWMLKLYARLGEEPGFGRFRFQNGQPRRLSDNGLVVKELIGFDGTLELWSCGRWQVTASDATHLTLQRVQ